MERQLQELQHRCNVVTAAEGIQDRSQLHPLGYRSTRHADTLTLLSNLWLYPKYPSGNVIPSNNDHSGTQVFADLDSHGGHPHSINATASFGGLLDPLSPIAATALAGSSELADSCRKLAAAASLAACSSGLRGKGMSKKEKEQAKRALERWADDATMRVRGADWRCPAVHAFSCRKIVAVPSPLRCSLPCLLPLFPSLACYVSVRDSHVVTVLFF